MMAWQVGQVCYGSELAAAQAAASAVGGSVVPAGSSAAVVEVGAVSPSSITYVFHPADGGASASVVVPFNPVPCQLVTWEDGVTMGWLVGGVWLAVLGARFIVRALRGSPESVADA